MSAMILPFPGPNSRARAAPALPPVRLHLRTQEGQPYGSVSRKCDRCGIMIWNGPPSDGGVYTEDPDQYANPPAGYVPCR